MSSDYTVHFGLAHLQLLTGDITTIRVDAMVNAANSALAGGGGVDGAIHAAGGPEIMAELDRIRKEIGSCPAGSAVVTGAGRLPARYVIHAVGPIYRDGRQGEPEALRSCYRTSLTLAAERLAKTVSFPSISTGVYGYPIGAAAQIALETVADWLREIKQPVHTVKLVQYSSADHDVYRRCADRLRIAWNNSAE